MSLFNVVPHAKDHEDCQTEETKALQAESPVNTEKLEKTKVGLHEMQCKYTILIFFSQAKRDIFFFQITYLYIFTLHPKCN